MKNTGITLVYLDQDDRTPRTVDSDRLKADLGAMPGNVTESGPHTRTFLTLKGQVITAWWSQHRLTGAIGQLFIDTRGLNAPDSSLADRRTAGA